MRIARIALALALLVAACSGAGGSDDAADPTIATGATDSTSDSGTTGAAGLSADCPAPAEAVEPIGPSVALEVVADDPLVEAVVYPHPDYEGNPWSHWGLGTVLEDGRFLSAIGDHLGADGNSYLYEYDPASGELTLVTDVLSVADHDPGSWGYGKVHGRIVADDCGIAHLMTYWGTRRGISYGGSYEGDLLLRWDTRSNVVESLGVPMPGRGVPSLTAVDATTLVGEAVDPESDPDAGDLFFVDVTTGEVSVPDVGDHVGFRDALVTADGRACIAAGDRDLTCVDPATGEVSSLGGLPGEWLRASTEPGPDGTVYASTREPDAFFALSPDGEIRDLGRARGYAAALALDPSGERFFYMPDAHGGAWASGAPIIAVDTATGREEVVARLADPIDDAFGLRVGGTYNIATDGERVFVALNVGRGEESFGEVILAVVHLP